MAAERRYPVLELIIILAYVGVVVGGTSALVLGLYKMLYTLAFG